MKKFIILLLLSMFVGFYANAKDSLIRPYVFSGNAKLNIVLDSLTPDQKKEFLFKFIDKNYSLLKDSLSSNHKLNFPDHYLKLMMAQMGYSDSTVFKIDFDESIHYFNNTMVNIQNPEQNPLPKLPCTDKFIVDVKICLGATVVAASVFGWEAGVFEAFIGLVQAKADFDACLKSK